MRLESELVQSTQGLSFCKSEKKIFSFPPSVHLSIHASIRGVPGENRKHPSFPVERRGNQRQREGEGLVLRLLTVFVTQ